MNPDRIALLKKFMEEEPENPFNSYALAMEYYDTNPVQSLLLLTRLSEQFPSYLPTYFKLAHLQWEEENWEGAESTFTAGITLAEEQKDFKALGELRASYQNFQFEKD